MRNDVVFFPQWQDGWISSRMYGASAWSAFIYAPWNFYTRCDPTRNRFRKKCPPRFEYALDGWSLFPMTFVIYDLLTFKWFIINVVCVWLTYTKKLHVIPSKNCLNCRGMKLDSYKQRCRLYRARMWFVCQMNAYCSTRELYGLFYFHTIVLYYLFIESDEIIASGVVIFWNIYTSMYLLL